MKISLFALCLCTPAVFAGIKPNEQTQPDLKLRIEGTTYLTDRQGLVIPEQVINVTVGRLVAIYRTDGFCYSGQITEIQEAPGVYKIFGKILNTDDPAAGFGFAINKGGFFSGAIREQKSNVTYVLEFNPIHKGFIFVRSTKYDKPSAETKEKSDYQVINHIVEQCLQSTNR